MGGFGETGLMGVGVEWLYGSGGGMILLMRLVGSWARSGEFMGDGWPL